jgi:hypothetical protein
MEKYAVKLIIFNDMISVTEKTELKLSVESVLCEAYVIPLMPCFHGPNAKLLVLKVPKTDPAQSSETEMIQVRGPYLNKRS